MRSGMAGNRARNVAQRGHGCQPARWADLWPRGFHGRIMLSASSAHRPQAAMSAPSRPVFLLLNVGHALDHLFMLIFATAVTSIAAEFGFARWEDLMPFGVGAFFLFGL